MTSTLKWLPLAAAVLAAAGPPPRTNPFNERLRALDPLDRVAALRRSVTSAGERCTRVTFYRDEGAYNNLGRWSVRCTPGGDYGVFLGPDASVQVRTCETMAELKLPACNLPPAPVIPTVRRR